MHSLASKAFMSKRSETSNDKEGGQEAVERSSPTLLLSSLGPLCFSATGSSTAALMLPSLALETENATEPQTDGSKLDAALQARLSSA